MRKIVAIVDSHDPNEEFSKKYQLVLSPIPQFWEKKMPLENLPVILYEGEVSNTIDALTEGHYYTVNEYYPECFMLKI